MVAGTKDDAEALREEAQESVQDEPAPVPNMTLVTDIDEALDFLGWRVHCHRREAATDATTTPGRPTNPSWRSSARSRSSAGPATRRPSASAQPSTRAGASNFQLASHTRGRPHQDRETSRLKLRRRATTGGTAGTHELENLPSLRGAAEQQAACNHPKKFDPELKSTYQRARSAPPKRVTRALIRRCRCSR
jgi:hypothetical protein